MNCIVSFWESKNSNMGCKKQWDPQVNLWLENFWGHNKNRMPVTGPFQLRIGNIPGNLICVGTCRLWSLLRGTNLSLGLVVLMPEWSGVVTSWLLPDIECEKYLYIPEAHLWGNQRKDSLWAIQILQIPCSVRNLVSLDKMGKNNYCFSQ